MRIVPTLKQHVSTCAFIMLHLLLSVCIFSGLFSTVALAQNGPSCSVEYNLPADLSVEIPDAATDADFMEFSWQHFLALNAPTVGGQINPTGDNDTQWDKWSSTADLLNQPNPGPPGSRYYPEVCQQVPNFQQYRAIQQVGKVDDSVLQAQTNGLSESPLIDRNGNFVRFEILLSPAMHTEVVSKGYNDPSVMNGLTSNVNLSCGEASYTGGDPANSQMGAIALKLAWMDASSFSDQKRSTYHLEDLLLYNPSYRNSSGEETCELKTMGLVGMHIAHKTMQQPNWIWISFEHADNAPDCTSLPPGPNSRATNTNCPTLTAHDQPDWNFFHQECSSENNMSCASCNSTPDSNDTSGECVNPFLDPDGTGWCLDQPPHPNQGLSRICHQVPLSHGQCANDPSIVCTSSADCSGGAACNDNYPQVTNYNSACGNAIIDAAQNAGGEPGVWINYVLAGAQWMAQKFTTCENVADQVWKHPNGPVDTTNLRQQVTFSLDGNGDPVKKPFFGNSSMESYDRSNCLGCHAKSYLDGYCSNDQTESCTTNKDCQDGGTCTHAETINTDFMYFLQVEVAEAPALRLPGSSLMVFHPKKRQITSHRGGGPPHTWVHWTSRSPRVLIGEVGSSKDPRCLADPKGTAKASLRFFHGESPRLRAEIDLPCERWRLEEGYGRRKAYHYFDPLGKSGPCRKVSIIDGRRVSATCTGPDLPSNLAGEEARIQVVLSTGRLRHCAKNEAFRSQQFLGGNLFTDQNISIPNRCTTP